MMGEGYILMATAVSIACVHTLIGPDHYLPFVAMAKARGWRLPKTLAITALCGLGHVLSSALLGGLGIVFGSRLASLVSLETTRGSWAAWALIGFGLMYLAWGLRQAQQHHPHVHRHGELIHRHPPGDNHHRHEGPQGEASRIAHRSALTPWALFIIFVLGPCEALIPLLMYPAAQLHSGWVIAVAIAFGLVTMLTMLAAVLVLSLGLERVRVPGLERFAHAVAGGAIVVCGTAISLLGM